MKHEKNTILNFHYFGYITIYFIKLVNGQITIVVKEYFIQNFITKYFIETMRYIFAFYINNLFEYNLSSVFEIWCELRVAF